MLLTSPDLWDPRQRICVRRGQPGVAIADSAGGVDCIGDDVAGYAVDGVEFPGCERVIPR